MILQNKAKKSFACFIKVKATQVTAVKFLARQRLFGSGEFVNTDLLESIMRCSSAHKLTLFAIAILFVYTSVSLRAQTSDVKANESESWTKTTESHPANMNPTRTTQSHQKSASGTVDHQTVERLGPDGPYEPYYDIETESVQVNGITTRTIERTFARDGGGQRILTQVTQEEKQSLQGGGEKVVRTTSNADLDGRLQVVQREVTDTKKINPEELEKNTTVFVSDGRGGMTPTTQVQQREKRNADHTVQVQTSTLLPDGSGKWQVQERKESTIKEDGKERTTEEQVLRPDVYGNMAPVSRTVSRGSETASGEKKNTIETYTQDYPGSAENNLQLSQRVTEVKRKGVDGAQTTEKHLEQRDLANPAAGLQVVTKTLQTMQPSASGTRETTSIEARDASGNFTVVSFDTQKSDNVHAVDVEIAPKNKEK
jgi:hypothetical protein